MMIEQISLARARNRLTELPGNSRELAPIIASPEIPVLGAHASDIHSATLKALGQGTLVAAGAPVPVHSEPDTNDRFFYVKKIQDPGDKGGPIGTGIMEQYNIIVSKFAVAEKNGFYKIKASVKPITETKDVSTQHTVFDTTTYTLDKTTGDVKMYTERFNNKTGKTTSIMTTTIEQIPNNALKYNRQISDLESGKIVERRISVDKDGYAVDMRRVNGVKWKIIDDEHPNPANLQ